MLRITTAIAAGDMLVRVEGTLEPESEADLGDEVEAIGRGVSFATKGDPEAARSAIERLSAGVKTLSRVLSPARHRSPARGRAGRRAQASLLDEPACPYAPRWAARRSRWR